MLVKVTPTRFWPRGYEVIFSSHYIRFYEPTGVVLCSRPLKFRILHLVYCTYVFMKKNPTIISQK